MNVRSVVYLIQCGDDGPVKIGYARASAAVRASELQTGCPYPLHVRFTVPGSVRLERALQLEMHGLHYKSEWFAPSPDFLTRFAEAYRAAGSRGGPQSRTRRLDPHPRAPR